MNQEYRTEFSEFAAILAIYFQEDRKPESFTQWLFEKIYCGGDTVIRDFELRTLKGYYYGEHDITSLAKKISMKLDLGSFAEAIKLTSEDSLMDLCDRFREWCPEINEDTYEMDIADRFHRIIVNAAQAKRKAEFPAKKHGSYSHKIDIEERYGMALVAEVMSTCPCAGCSNQLLIKGGGQITLNYRIVKINPNELGDSEDNLIAMCPKCAVKYELNSSPENIIRLQKIKAQFDELTEIQEITAGQNLCEEISKVLAKIPGIPYPMDIDLNYDPVALKNKIQNDNRELLTRIKVWVNLYYFDVQDTLKELDMNGMKRFEPFCLQVRYNYIQLKNQGYSQIEIYDGMIEWLHKTTNESRHICEIVIAYFVQKCEVFDVIPE